MKRKRKKQRSELRLWLLTGSGCNSRSLYSSDLRHAIVIGDGAKKPEANLIEHSGEIVTPQPYSVFALCKVYEHFQRN